MRTIKVIATVQAKHQRGKFWAEQSIRDDAARLQRVFGVPVEVRTQQGGWLSRGADGRIEFVMKRPLPTAEFQRKFDWAVKGNFNPELWQHWDIGGAVVEVNA